MAQKNPQTDYAETYEQHAKCIL